MREKIILGTVQLGLPYGINNVTGKPSHEQAFAILDFAFENNIRLLDSADGYGEALQIIGLHKEKSGKTFDVINKFKADGRSLAENLDKSLALLQTDSLYCYMYHQFADYVSGRFKNALEDLKTKRLIKKIGVSLYSVDELKMVISDSQIDIIQLPVNLLDLGDQKEALLSLAHEAGKEIHARSVYLQGLFLKDVEKLTGNLLGLKPYLLNLGEICQTQGISLKKAALNFALHKNYINHVVLGVEHVDQLKENLKLIDPFFETSKYDRLHIGAEDRYLLNPANWKP